MADRKQRRGNVVEAHPIGGEPGYQPAQLVVPELDYVQQLHSATTMMRDTLKGSKSWAAFCIILIVSTLALSIVFLIGIAQGSYGNMPPRDSRSAVLIFATNYIFLIFAIFNLSLVVRDEKNALLISRIPVQGQAVNRVAAELQDLASRLVDHHSRKIVQGIAFTLSLVIFIVALVIYSPAFTFTAFALVIELGIISATFISVKAKQDYNAAERLGHFIQGLAPVDQFPMEHFQRALNIHN